MNDLYLVNPKNSRISVQLNTYVAGTIGYLVLTNPAQNLRLALTGEAAALIVQLRLAADLIEDEIINKTEPGVRHGEAEPQQVERFSTIKLHELSDAEPEKAKALTYLHFKNGPHAVRSIFTEWEKYLPALTASEQQTAEPAPPSQREQDLVKLQTSGRADLFKKNGAVNKKIVAQILGIPNGGSTTYPRIQAAAEELEKSTISTSVENQIDDPPAAAPPRRAA